MPSHWNNCNSVSLLSLVIFSCWFTFQIKGWQTKEKTLNIHFPPLQLEPTDTDKWLAQLRLSRTRREVCKNNTQLVTGRLSSRYYNTAQSSRPQIKSLARSLSGLQVLPGCKGDCVALSTGSIIACGRHSINWGACFKATPQQRNAWYRLWFNQCWNTLVWSTLHKQRCDLSRLSIHKTVWNSYHLSNQMIWSNLEMLLWAMALNEISLHMLTSLQSWTRRLVAMAGPLFETPV